MTEKKTSEAMTRTTYPTPFYRRRVFACDFETTVYAGQTSTEVWSAAMVEIGTEDVLVMHSIDDFFKYIFRLKGSMVLYFHNLKFDGTFILYWLKNNPNFQEAYSEEDGFPNNKDMPDSSFKYLISLMGEWYSITIKHKNRIIEIRDSLKLLPFSLKKIGEDFKTKHRKLEMEYTGYRFAGCEITDEELEYIRNDVLVLKEALEFMFSQGHSKLTIGSCCMEEFKAGITKEDYSDWLPDVYEMQIDEDAFGAPTAGDYIHHAYKGGWCYVAKGRDKKVQGPGITLDVNSLYPSMMSSESGNRYPVGEPHFWKGEIPKEALIGDRYYFVRIRTRFYLKPGKLPFVQIKGNLLYRPNECLESSDVIVERKNKTYRYKEYKDLDGSHNDGRLTLTLTMTDYELLRKHYRLEDCEVLDGCWFHSMIGLFDAYINKYRELKMRSKGAMRQLAKLFLNNLYGKMAASPDSSFKKAIIKDGALHFIDVRRADKKPGYIPIGAAITSYARSFTITAAQKNYHGPNRPGFIYADTDSIHCDLTLDQVKGVRIDPKAFCCWAHEASWDTAYFTRQKTYIERIIEKDEEPVAPYYDIKCAGMPNKCKYILNLSLLGADPEDSEVPLSETEREFVMVKRELQDFDTGLLVPGKLVQKRIAGGCVLYETTFEMN